jgi:hypothetical protein
MKIAKGDVVVLLNEFYLKGVYRLKVSSPLFGGVLYSFELKKEPVTNAMTLDQYSERYDSLCLKLEPEIAEEIPEPSEDYIWIFQSSGVVKPENYSEIVMELEKAADRDLMRGDKPLYVGFDTNTLVRRFPEIMPQIRCGFCLHSGILDELHPRFVEEKLRGFKADMLRKRGLNVFNQPPMRARKFKVGAVEYRKLLRREHAEEIGDGAGDVNMIKDYQRFQKRRNVDVLLVSEDSNFVEIANDHKVKAVHMRQARDVPRRLSPSWRELVELLYTTAIAFGTIRMKSVLIHGIWSGKTWKDWNAERLRLEFENKSLEDEMKRSLRILKLCGS